ncbi:MAG: flagellar biosynthesis protein FlhB [Anaerolineales bacterium]|nr:flagellar biosynthesis protein FlhB [Anaerolineales bacterium]
MSEKTEKPTAKRIRELRDDGNIAKSHEINAAVALLLSAWLFSGTGEKLIQDIQSLLIKTITDLPQGKPISDWLWDLLGQEGANIALDMGLILVTFLAVGVTITLLQTRFLWAKKKLGFHFNKLNPLNGLKNIFSISGVVEFFKAFLKVLIIGWVAYNFLSARATSILGLAQTDFLSALTYWAELAIALTYRIGMAYIVLAVADYAYQLWQYNKNTRMTKEEVKEELKQREGDPMIKNRIRGQQRRMARLRMMANVHKADVIITNPTHLAIAIRYDQESMNAPKVLAKGAYLLAERIVKIAQASNIPVVQNIPLAHAIYKSVKIDQEIPPELYVAMAEILARIYSMRNRKPIPAVAL